MKRFKMKVLSRLFLEHPIQLPIFYNIFEYPQSNSSDMVRTLRLILSCIIISAIHHTVTAQSQLPKGIAIAPSIYLGRMFKHTPNLIGSPQGLSRGVALNFSYETYGRRAWETAYKFPLVGMYAAWIDIDDGNHFGEAFFFAPYVQFVQRERERSKTFITVGMGAGYLTKIYNEANNTNNNAVGSHWNIAVNLRYGWQYSLTDQLTFTSSLGLNHFSNGGTTPNNLGINLADLQLGLHYTPHPVSPNDYKIYELPQLNPRWDVEVAFNLGLEQHNLALGGAFYPIYNGMLAIGYQKHFKHRWRIGLDYEYNTKERELMEHIHKFDEDERAWRSSKLGIFVGEELRIRRFSLYFDMGFYLHRGQASQFFYNKLGFRYYYIYTDHFKMYLSPVIKTELITAKYVGFCTGMVF